MKKISLPFLTLFFILTSHLAWSMIPAPLEEVNEFNKSQGSCYNDRCNGVLVNRLYVSNGGHDNSRVYVGTSSNESGLSCNATSGVYVRLEPTDHLFETMYETLLQARLAKIPVTLRMKHNDDTTNDCIVQYVVLY